MSMPLPERIKLPPRSEDGDWFGHAANGTYVITECNGSRFRIGDGPVLSLEGTVGVARVCPNGKFALITEWDGWHGIHSRTYKVRVMDPEGKTRLWWRGKGCIRKISWLGTQSFMIVGSRGWTTECYTGKITGSHPPGTRYDEALGTYCNGQGRAHMFTDIGVYFKATDDERALVMCHCKYCNRRRESCGAHEPS